MISWQLSFDLSKVRRVVSQGQLDLRLFGYTVAVQSAPVSSHDRSSVSVASPLTHSDCEFARLQTGDVDQASISPGADHQYNPTMSTQSHFPEKLQFSGHETFPLRQLWLRKAYLAVNGATNENAEIKSPFTDDSAIPRFGVGKNMVAAIRHWALACDVLVEGPNGLPSVGPIGNLLFGSDGVDAYLEKPATSWLIHWMLAGRAIRSTTWYWVFNRVASQTFSRDSVVDGLAGFAAQRQTRASLVTLKRDLEVCLRCYLPRDESRDADDVAEPLLADLGLLIEGPVGTFQFRRGAQNSLPNSVFLFALLEFWERFERATSSTQKTLSFEAIAHDFGSPGRVFKLDENSVVERLQRLEEISKGGIRWTDSAGLKQVSKHDGILSDEASMSFLRKHYGH